MPRRLYVPFISSFPIPSSAEFSTKGLRLSTLSLAVCSVCIAPAWAQQAAPAPAAPPGATAGDAAHAEAATLPAVTVTARKSAESAKDLPFTVQSIGGEEIEARRLGALEDVLRATPGVDVNSGGGMNDANVRIRGVGSLFQVSADDSSVIINLDGVPLSMRHAKLGTLDVERVEVLKGPQGTLLGRNSEAGAINVISRKPTRELEGHVRGEIGQQGQRLIEGAVGGPLTERLSGRLALRHSGEHNVVQNLQTGAPVAKPNDLAWRGSLLWDMQPGTSALFTTERSQSKEYAGLVVPIPYTWPPVQDITPDMFDGNRKTLARHSVEINHDLPFARLTSVTGYVTADTLGRGAYDRIVSNLLLGMPVEIIRADRIAERTLAQDLRLASLPAAPVFWVVGYNYHRGKRQTHSDIPLRQMNSRLDFSATSHALYGEVTYPMAERLKLTAGLRHTWEDKDYRAAFTAAGTPSSDARQLRDRYFTGRLGASYAVTPHSNVYLIWARGHKSGGFSDIATQVADGKPYLPGAVDSVEAGWKSESADRRWHLNVAAFTNRVKDDHLLAYNLSNFSSQAVNVNTRSDGLELQGRWRATPRLTLSGGMSYIHGRIASLAVTNTPAGDAKPGNRLPDIPKWSATASMDWRQPLPAFAGMQSPQLAARLSWRYVGKRAADPQNSFDLGAYHKVDMRVGVTSGSTEFYVWGDNLLNKRHDLYGYYLSPKLNVGMPARGRSLGIGLAHYF
ncbi:TonB-dependent receptor [Ottowia testudinis]|uniref:TonB-dependent receptor n=1 Tax=Ottowia testudinis TaxID=2816950 RepID=A0A975CHM3_9BURK|nr:TonB-dependent receptor [Ottowia testudinis]QTD44354.1 TonB-dependent receptor [Ottowia testudinis]